MSSMMGVDILVGSNKDYLLIRDVRHVELSGDCVGLAKREDLGDTLLGNKV